MLLNFSLVHRRPRPNETRDAVFCHPITERHADIMVRNRKNKRVFNDVSFYLSLKQLENCKSVDITSLVIRHNDYCHGIQATYRVTYMDGTTELREGPKNFFSNGYYAYGGGRSRIRDTTIALSHDEYIQAIRVNQGEILDGILVITNQRMLHVGGPGGGDPVDVLTTASNQKVVAFAGTIHGIWHRLGCYTINRGWETVGPYVLLRKLVRDDRAHALRPRSGPVTRLSKTKDTKDSGLILSIVENLEVFHEDIFRHVMRFL
jgi:hypothetical protein